MISVKDAFDNMPIAVCFFDKHGTVRLINRRMLNVSTMLLGSEMQTLTELHNALEAPPKQISVTDGAVPLYNFPDGKTLRFEEKIVTDSDGASFVQVTAADVTELAERQAELRRENEQLSEANRRARQLYENMAEIVREEEILSMKMRVHDDIGHSILSARRALLSNEDIEAVRSNAAAWEKSIELLHHANNMPEQPDPMEYAEKRAEALGVKLIVNGDLPNNSKLRYLFSLAVRECVTNCVRHANGNEVYVTVSADGDSYTA
ncbi:MAG: hypothetical protein UHL70_02315, partial [Acutalibacteraceae bacterium]|nr:hypothetical protein [Acutalibacteraceae bacterium]